MDLDGYNPKQHPECQGAVDAVKAWLFKPGTSLALLGPTGVGKTHLAKCAQNALRDARYRKWVWVANAAREGHHGDVRRTYQDPSPLIIDDIGMGYDTDFTRGLLTTVVEERLGKTTLYTSNLTLRELAEDFDARIASRLIRGENEVFAFSKCPDYAL